MCTLPAAVATQSYPYKRDTNNGALTFLGKVSQGDVYGFFCSPNCPTLQGLAGAYQVLISPDGQYAYISDITDNKIVVLYRNSSTGALVMDFINGPVQLYTSPNLSQAFRVTLSPDGGYVYTASFNDSAVTAFKRDASTGKLTYLTKYKDGIGGIDGISACTSVAISPDGTHLYATGFAGKAVTVFNRDATTGLLTQAQVIKRNPFVGAGGVPALDGARDVAPSPDGKSIYITGFNDNKVVALNVANPIPTLTSLAPSSAQAGGAAFTLTVNGEGIMPGSAIYWGAAALPTT